MTGSCPMPDFECWSLQFRIMFLNVLKSMSSFLKKIPLLKYNHIFGCLFSPSITTSFPGQDSLIQFVSFSTKKIQLIFLN